MGKGKQPGLSVAVENNVVFLKFIHLMIFLQCLFSVIVSELNKPSINQLGTSYITCNICRNHVHDIAINCSDLSCIFV